MIIAIQTMLTENESDYFFTILGFFAKLSAKLFILLDAIRTGLYFIKCFKPFLLQTPPNLKLDHIILISVVINLSLNQRINEVKGQCVIILESAIKMVSVKVLLCLILIRGTSSDFR